MAIVPASTASVLNETVAWAGDPGYPHVLTVCGQGEQKNTRIRSTERHTQTVLVDSGVTLTCMGRVGCPVEAKGQVEDEKDERKRTSCERHDWRGEALHTESQKERETHRSMVEK